RNNRIAAHPVENQYAPGDAPIPIAAFETIDIAHGGDEIALGAEIVSGETVRRDGVMLCPRAVPVHLDDLVASVVSGPEEVRQRLSRAVDEAVDSASEEA